MNILVLNCGSSSIKYQLIDMSSHKILKKDRVEGLEDTKDYSKPIEEIIETLKEQDIDAVGHRVVHGGKHFFKAVKIDDKVIASIEACIPLAPLHNPNNLAGINASLELLGELPQVAVFDTMFHQTMPRRAKTYAIPQDLAEKHNFYRYGFHGSSHAFVSQKAADFLKQDIKNLRLISCHLGNGASVCAIEYGRSIDTSMGQSPLEGLVMGTRAGDIDAAALLDLGKAEGLDYDQLKDLINKKSGLLGLSGLSSDMREIQKAAETGDEKAQLAINVFCHRIRKYIGAYAAIMGGVDAIIMTGGIGENSHNIRRRILQRLEFLGLLFSPDKNQAVAAVKGGDVAAISENHSKTMALAVGTDEELYIARQTKDLVEKLSGKQVDGNIQIPIAVSARHVHLDQATFKWLFGEDAKLTEYKALSQPGQFASDQKVTLVGPRGQIENVRILGPLRKACQIEISRTDEFKLGVDAPVRHSGKVAGSAPITLIGPKAKIHLKEGLICAWRHIHLTPQDAERYGLADQDNVQVAINSGNRELIFGDVLVRVSAKYKTEMHIDTDEANAANLSGYTQGVLEKINGVSVSLKK